MITINGHEIKPTIFPDKTSQVWKLPETAFKLIVDSGKSFVHWNFESEAEIMHLAQLNFLLNEYAPFARHTLVMDTMPYARQDKEVTNESTFALRSFIALLHSMSWDEIRTFDVHNPEMTMRLLGSKLKNEKLELKHLPLELIQDRDMVIGFPDKGAYERYDFLKMFPHLVGHKVRDQKTGYIKEYQYDSNVSIKGKNVFMVDDLCDGGMTFILLTKQLLQDGAKSVNLYTSHGIYSKGVDVLFDAGISRIFNKDGEVTR